MKAIATLFLFLISFGFVACASHEVVPESGDELQPESAPVSNMDSDLDAKPANALRSRYQTIIDGFESATVAPEVNDFDPLDELHPLTRCYSTRASDPQTMSEMVIRQMSVSYSGTPAFGPLFPGVPDRVETALVIGKNNGWVNSKVLTNEKRQVFELHPMGNTLVIHILKNAFGIYQDFGNPAEIWLRKGRDHHIYFKVFRLDAEQNRSEAFVGYCFKK